MMQEAEINMLSALNGLTKRRPLIETEEAVIAVLAYVLRKKVAKNDATFHEADVLTIFHACKAPSMRIGDYVRRIGQYAGCSRVCLLGALIYLNRACAQNPTLKISSLNIHRLFITAVTVAVKFFDDEYYKNAHYACIGGVPIAEMNALEVNFLLMLRYKLFVRKEELDQVEDSLIAEVMTSRDSEAYNVQRILMKHGYIKSYSLYGELPSNDSWSEKDLVYVPSSGERNRRQAVFHPIGEGRPRSKKHQTCAPTVDSVDRFWSPTLES